MSKKKSNKKKSAMSIFVMAVLFGMAIVMNILLIYFPQSTMNKVIEIQKSTTEQPTDTIEYTNVIIKNSSDQDSVQVWLSIQAPNSVVGMFGIQPQDTSGSCSLGYFYAKKDSIYTTNLTGPLQGACMAFNTYPQSCESALSNGFKTGVNVFEFTINVPSETFDISCEDGVNCILKTSVSDTVNWSTGYSNFQQVYKQSQNNIKLDKNCNIRGVFPYRCTDCIDLGPQPPKDCFKVKYKCNGNRTCQVSRTLNNGGTITCEYLGNK